MEPVSSIAAISSATNIIGKIIQNSFAYNEVPRDVQTFQSSIESFSMTLGKARRLRRVTSHLLDDRDKEEIDMNIKRAADILDDISGTIEACRKDLAKKGTVSARNRILWLVRDHDVFLARTHSFGMCHQNLNSDINGMRQLQVTPQPLPPAYALTDSERSLRPPSRRPLSSQSKCSEWTAYEPPDSPDMESPNLRPVTLPHSDKIVVDEETDREVALVGLTPCRSRSSLTSIPSSLAYDRSTTSDNNSTNIPRMVPYRMRKSFSSLSSFHSESDTSSAVLNDAANRTSSESMPLRSRSNLVQTPSPSDCNRNIVGDDEDTLTSRRAPWRTSKSFGSVSSRPSVATDSSSIRGDAPSLPLSESTSLRGAGSHTLGSCSSLDYNIGTISGDHDVIARSSSVWETGNTSDLTHGSQKQREGSTSSQDVSVSALSAALVTPRRQRRGYMIT